MIDWQPIETAPRDGTEVLAWIDTEAGGHVTTVEWYRNEWVECCDFDGWIAGSGPTHWMPLPARPKGTSHG